MQASITEVELSNLATLCSSLHLHNYNDNIAGKLLGPIAATLGAESAVFRHINLEYTRPQILNLTSIGVPSSVPEDYRTHFQHLDPFLDKLNYSTTQNRHTHSRAGFPTSDERAQRYYREFLLPNNLVQHAEIMLKDPAGQQAWIFNFHRSAFAPNFTALELARARMIGVYLQAQVPVSTQSNDIFAGLSSSILQQLSPREQEIATTVTRGLSNKQIALVLIISPRTVENHLNNIYEKLHVNTRTQLISLLHKTEYKPAVKN